jgi:hypothetical protein
MKTIVLFACIFLFGAANAFAQVVKTNEKGEKIIEYPDGSWKPFLEENAGDPLGAPDNAADPYLQPDPEEVARKKAIRFAEILSADAAQLESFAEESRMQRLVLEDELAEMKNSREFSSIEIQETERKLRQERDREDLAFSLYNQAVRLAQDAENLVFLKPKKRDKALAKLETEKASLDDRMLLLSNLKQPSDPGVPSPQNRTYLAYDPAKNTQLNPPALPCVFTYNSVDKFTGKMRRDLEPVRLFTHTPNELRPFLRDREYITCRANLADLSDGLLFLSLEFSIASNSAPTAFGGIPNGSILSILTLDGESIRLINSKSDAGNYDDKTGVYVYRAQYQISGVIERTLQTKELDKLRVIWATGYEDYEVFEMDFFRNQINCLRNTN